MPEREGTIELRFEIPLICTEKLVRVFITRLRAIDTVEIAMSLAPSIIVDSENVLSEGIGSQCIPSAALVCHTSSLILACCCAELIAKYGVLLR